MLADLNNLPKRRSTSCNATFRTHACTYVCTHDTQPPDGQVIQTDQSTTALLRIVRKRERSAAGVKKGAELKDGKRVLDAGDADERPAKKLNTGTAHGAVKSGQAANPSQHPKATETLTAEELKSKTVPQLKELLRSRSLPVSGAKDELIRRLIDHQRANKYK